MLPPDFSTWYAVQNPKSRQLVRIIDPGAPFGGCLGYVRGLENGMVILDIPFGVVTQRRAYAMHQIRKAD